MWTCHLLDPQMTLPQPNSAISEKVGGRWAHNHCSTLAKVTAILLKLSQRSHVLDGMNGRYAVQVHFSHAYLGHLFDSPWSPCKRQNPGNILEILETKCGAHSWMNPLVFTMQASDSAEFLQSSRTSKLDQNNRNLDLKFFFCRKLGEHSSSARRYSLAFHKAVYLLTDFGVLTRVRRKLSTCTDRNNIRSLKAVFESFWEISQ